MPSTAERSIDETRLLRAMRLLPFVERLGPMQFKVPGHHEPHYYVDLSQDPPCLCCDMEFAGRQGHQCKHTLACRWLNRDLPVLMAAGNVLLRVEKHLAEHVGSEDE